MTAISLNLQEKYNHFHWLPHNHREALRRRRIAALIVLTILGVALTLCAWYGVTLFVNATRPAPLCEEGLVYLNQKNLCVTQETWWDYHKNH